jgi:hypothetical protein
MNSEQQPPFVIVRTVEGAPSEVTDPSFVPRPSPTLYAMEQTTLAMRSIDHAGTEHEATTELFVYGTRPGVPRNFGKETVVIPEKTVVGSYIAPIALKTAVEHVAANGYRSLSFGNALDARNYIDAFHVAHGEGVTKGRRTDESELKRDVAAVMGPLQEPYNAGLYDAMAALHGTDAETIAELQQLNTLNADILNADIR